MSFRRVGGLVVGDGDGLVAAVAAGRDQREAALLHQQMMQRRIRQHDAEIGRAVRHVRRRCRSRRFGLQTARWARPAIPAIRTSAGEISQYSRAISSDGIIRANGFSSRCLRWRRRATASALRASTRSWNPPMPLRATISPCAQSCDGIGDRAIELRPAHRTGVGLGVKAAVRGILVLLAAPRTEHEAAHGRVGPVIRDVDDDGVARAAVRAVGEGIFKAAILGIEQLVPAVGAGGQIGQNVDRLAGVVVAVPESRSASSPRRPATQIRARSLPKPSAAPARGSAQRGLVRRGLLRLRRPVRRRNSAPIR